MRFCHPTIAVLFVLQTILFCNSALDAQSVELPEGPKSLQPNTEYELNVEVDQQIAGIVQAQLVGADWKKVADVWDQVEAGKQSKTLKFKVPADTAESIVKGVKVSDAAKASPRSDDGTKKSRVHLRRNLHPIRPGRRKETG